MSDKPEPTEEELNAILSGKGQLEIQRQPDGSILAVPAGTPKPPALRLGKKYDSVQEMMKDIGISEEVQRKVAELEAQDRAACGCGEHAGDCEDGDTAPEERRSATYLAVVVITACAVIAFLLAKYVRN